MRISSLAPFLLALQYSPAAAQPLPLSDSLVVGFWDFNTEDFDPNDTAMAKIRMAGFFTGQNTFEQAMWSKTSWYPDTTPIYTGIRMTGGWFIRDTLLGMFYTTCVGFTEQGRRECAIEADGLGDTDYVTMEVMDLRVLGRSRVMRSTMENWELPIWRYEGTVRDMIDPGFWEGASLALLPYRRLPGRGNGAPAFDVLGRQPSGKATVWLYQGPIPARSPAAR
jgi:hypothetical protein